MEFSVFHTVIQEMGEEVGNPTFRIGLRTKGCNGMAYTLEYAEPESKLKFEEKVSFPNFVKTYRFPGRTRRSIYNY